MSRDYVELKKFEDVNTNSKVKRLVAHLDQERKIAIIFTVRILDRRRMKRLMSDRLAIWYVGNIPAEQHDSLAKQIKDKIEDVDFSQRALSSTFMFKQ